jgi:hypothetical protein
MLRIITPTCAVVFGVWITCHFENCLTSSQNYLSPIYSQMGTIDDDKRNPRIFAILERCSNHCPKSQRCKGRAILCTISFLPDRSSH